MSFALAYLLRPFAALLLLGLALGIAYRLRPLIPDGRVKELLYRRRVAWWDRPLLRDRARHR